MNKKAFVFAVAMMMAMAIPIAHANTHNSLLGQTAAKAQALAAKIQAAGKSRVAVLDFTALDGETVTELGRLLVELLNVHLASADGISVVDRFHLENVLKEQKLTKSGLFNPKLSSKIGELSGVEAVIIGTITELGGDLLVSFKIIDTETATNIGAELLTLKRSSEVERLFSTILSGETDAFTTSDKVFVNSASFFTDHDTIRCQGLGTFKSYTHARAQACYLLPKGENKTYFCSYLDQSEPWKMYVRNGGHADSCKYPRRILKRLVRENGRY